MYQVLELEKDFGKYKALRGVSLRFERGQFVALMGENGAGKSTFLRILAQQELMTSGDVLIDGNTLRSALLNLNERIAFISEDMNLPSNISLEEWAGYFRGTFPGYSLSLFHELSKEMRIDLGSDFSSLSRGQKVKALFCLHAAKRPAAYLLDEVTSVLDTASCFVLMRFLGRERERGCLVVASTNIAAEMQVDATDLCFIRNGQISFYGKTSEFDLSFFKFRCSPEWLLENESRLQALVFKRIRANSDATISCLTTRKNEAEVRSLGQPEDRRLISIEDVAVYLAEGTVL